MGSRYERYVCKYVHKKDVRKIVEVYKKYTGSELRVPKKPRAPVTTLSKNDLEVPGKINKYRSFMGKFMWYATKVGPDVENEARELTVHMSNSGPEHW